jgi:hypothetical protein
MICTIGSFFKLIGIDVADLTEMMELVRLFVQIALMRKGPQDLPASAVLLGATAAGFFITHCLISVALPPIPGPWFGHLIVETAFTFAWYALLLRLLHRPERYLQTTTAVFGYLAVLAPVWIGTVWLVRRLADDETWRLPVSVLGLVVIVWRLAANAHVLKAALEWGTPACIALVILQYIAQQILLVYLFSGTI